MKVQDLMRTNVVTLHSSDALDIAADIMNMGRIRHLPVVDADNRVVGIVTQRDLYRASISSVLGFAQAKEHEWLGQVTVRDVMTKEVTAIGPEAGVVEAVDKLVTAKFGCLPVVDGLMAPALPRPPRDLSAPSYQTHISDAELLRIISEGKGAMPGAADVLSTEDLRSVIAFVRLLSPGYELYDRFCAVCHGPDGHPPALALQERGGAALVEEEPPTFDQAYFRTHPDEQVRVWIRHMLKENRAVMPHFAGEISADKVRQILTYLRTLPPES